MKIIKTLFIVVLVLVGFSLFASPIDDENGSSTDNVKYPVDGLYTEPVSSLLLTGSDMGDGWTTSSKHVSPSEPNWTSSDGNTFLKQYQPGHQVIIALELMKYDTVANASLAYEGMTSVYSHYSNAESFGVGNASMSLKVTGIAYHYFLYFQTGNLVMKMFASAAGLDAILDMNENDFQNIAKNQFIKISDSLDV